MYSARCALEFGVTTRQLERRYKGNYVVIIGCDNRGPKRNSSEYTIVAEVGATVLKRDKLINETLFVKHSRFWKYNSAFFIYFFLVNNYRHKIK
jgi:hypothetical protein